MNILIIGASGSGKSKLGDLVKTTIFRLDENSKILTSDPDRENKSFGEGSNTYNIAIKQVPLEDLNLPIPPEELRGNDVIVILPRDSISKWFRDVLES